VVAGVRGGHAIWLVVALLAVLWGGTAAAHARRHGKHRRCTIVGTPRADRLIGTAKRDVICGRGGADTIRGGRGNDLLIGGPGSDRLVGGRGRDRLLGGPGADRLLGGPGRDVLRGGVGKDVLAGGRGSDLCRDSPATRMRGCNRRPRGRHHQQASSQAPSSQAPSCCATWQNVDLQPPYRPHAWFARRYVDTSAGETALDVFVQAWDPSGLGSAALRIDGPAGAWRSVELGAGADAEAPFEASVVAPASTPAGDYRVVSLTVADGKGNAETVTGAELREDGYRPEFEVFEGPDLEGPKLTNFSGSPAEIDTSAAPGGIDFAISATDDLSGVKWAAGSVQLPGWEPGPLRLSGACGGEIPPDEGTRHDGTWLHTYSLVEHAIPGYYEVSGLYLCDLVGNMSHYTEAELEGLGYPTEFLETGPGDTTPPEIVDFWLEPKTLRASAGEATVSYYVHVRDPDTGFGEWPDKAHSSIHASFDPPGNPGEWSSSGRTPELVSGTTHDGVWRGEMTLEADGPIGEYEVEWLAAADRAGNRVLLKHTELEATGWGLNFENLP